MSGKHSHALYVHAHSRVHDLAPECKLLAQILFVLAVVATPRQAFWAFGVYALILLVLIRLADVPYRFVAKRMVFEVPFVLFAVLLPFIGRGEQVEIWGMSLSVEGLWGAWNILAKATLGVVAAILMAATTTTTEFLRAFDRLHLPQVFVSTASFMIRYMDVIAEEMRRMRIARESRGHNPRWIWQAKAVAASAGALFIRTYERGERVYLAMVSRGYTGSMPTSDVTVATRKMWGTALAVPALAGLVMIAAWLGVA